MKQTTVTNNPVELTMTKKLMDAFKPVHLEFVNESFMHNVPKGSETHFKLLIVSESFVNQPLVKSHQQVYSVLKEELQGKVHALSIVAKTPEQYEKCLASGELLTKSPPCQGGFGK